MEEFVASKEITYINLDANRSTVVSGTVILGIELGFIRIKAVLVNEKNKFIASGSHQWE